VAGIVSNRFQRWGWKSKDTRSLPPEVIRKTTGHRTGRTATLDDAMFKLSSPAPHAALSPHLTLRRAGIGIALLGAVALWLWALPTLLTRDGFIPRGDACAPASYRDPVTGQSRPAPSVRTAASAACPAPPSSGRS
jgi:hypothetical protein